MAVADLPPELWDEAWRLFEERAMPSVQARTEEAARSIGRDLETVAKEVTEDVGLEVLARSDRMSARKAVERTTRGYVGQLRREGKRLRAEAVKLARKHDSYWRLADTVDRLRAWWLGQVVVAQVGALRAYADYLERRG